MRTTKILTSLYLLLLAGLLPCCKKVLDVKADKKLVTPHSLADVQALLDHSNTYIEPAADEASADNYYLTDASYNGLASSYNRSIYTWDSANLFNGITSDWGNAYRKIYYCNTALDALPAIASADPTEWNNCKGQALFKRGKTFWHIAVTWSLAYDPATSAADLGIPLRLNSDFNEISTRASVKETYDHIIADLQAAIPLLPVTPLHVVRPSRPAAYAMLARVYLSMRQYTAAKAYADSALSLFPVLLDYNAIDPLPAFPFANPNAESIFVTVSGSSLLSPSNGKADSSLYGLYAITDLRKTLFFKSLGNNQYSFRESYSNSDSHFSGLSSSELYLIRAECQARAGKLSEALSDLNALLMKRYKTGSFVPVTASNAVEALQQVLVERRKELVLRFTRWSDIKRLNKEGAGIILKRFVNGKLYTLAPNDLRYALPLPEDVLALSGMPQNPR